MMQDNHILVIKKSGEREPFSEGKVLHSMQRVGLPHDLQPMVLAEIKKKLHENITTAEIFQTIIDSLKEKDVKATLRFNLKQAIFDLGPTGFPFEKYMERVFNTMGYKTQVDALFPGECVNHEIDIVLEQNAQKDVVEAKFHNQQGVKTEIHVLLYTYARFLDVAGKNNVTGVWVVTNTKLSLDAAKYAECKKIRTIAWNYPARGNLQDFVEEPSMYPITILSIFSHEEKQRLLQNDIVLACDILFVPDEELKGKLFLEGGKLEKAKEIAHMVCKNHLHKAKFTHESDKITSL